MQHFQGVKSLPHRTRRLRDRKDRVKVLDAAPELKKIPITPAIIKLTQRVNAPYKPRQNEAKKRPIILAPEQIEEKYLTNEGGLNITEPEMAAIWHLMETKLKKNIKEGRIRKQEIHHLTEIKTHYSAEYKLKANGEIAFLGILAPGAIAKGAFGKIKILLAPIRPDNSDNKPWKILKIQQKRQLDMSAVSATEEFEVTKEMDLADFIIERHSPSHNDSQYEMIMDWLPGETVHDALYGNNSTGLAPRRIHVIFLVEILINIVKQVIEVHNRGYFHRDIKELNLILDWVNVKLFDFGFAKFRDDCFKNKCTPLGTPGYEHAKIYQEDQKIIGDFSNYDWSTEMYPLGVIFAQVFQLIPAEQIKKLDELTAPIDEKDMPKRSQQQKAYKNFVVQGGFQLIDKKEIPENNAFIFELYDYIKNTMLNMKKEIAPEDFEECIEHLEAQQKKLQAQLQLNVAVIDIQEFAELMQNKEGKSIGKVFLQFNELQINFIKLIDPANNQTITFKQEILIRRLLNKSRATQLHPEIVRVSPDFSDLPQRLKEEKDKSKKYCYHFFTSEQLQVKFKEADLKVIKFERLKPHPNNLFSKHPTTARNDVLKRPAVGFV